MKKKTNFFDFLLKKIGFPEKKDDEYLKIKKSDYDLMKKITERQDNFAIQIMKQTKTIEQNDEIIKSRDEEIENLKFEKRKLNGKIGGMQRQLNILKQKNSTLFKEIENTHEIIKELNNNINIKKLEIEMLKNKGKRKKDIESYKNYFEARKELEKREKNE